jgi:RHS repeat-associated protein
VTDDKRRVALVETRTLDAAGIDPAPRQAIRYQLGNHLGSACLELDDQAQIVSYEEYSPYGSSTYQAVRSQTETPKRYRYAGKERDEESGLYYYGARFYAPWLARWISCDPAAMRDGPDLYLFVHGNPVTLSDPNGRAAALALTELAPVVPAGAAASPISSPPLEVVSGEGLGNGIPRRALRLVPEAAIRPPATSTSHSNRNGTHMSSEEFDDIPEVRAWIDPGGGITLYAATAEGDPVELSASEARRLAARLLELANAYEE